MPSIRIKSASCAGGVRLLFLSLLVIFLFLFLHGCATVGSFKRPQVEAVRTTVSRIDFEGIRIVVDVDVLNPYPFRINSMPVEATIIVKEKQILSGEINSKCQIQPHMKGTVTLPVTLAFSDLAKFGKEIANAPELEYKVDGLLKVPFLGARFAVPFAHEGVFPVLRPPTVSAVKVQFEDVSLSKARVIADVEIANPNVFDVGIKDLSFALNMGNAQVSGLKTKETAVAAKNKKRLLLSGEISAANGLINVLMNGVSGQPEISASGLLETPYGYIKL